MCTSHQHLKIETLSVRYLTWIQQFFVCKRRFFFWYIITNLTFAVEENLYCVWWVPKSQEISIIWKKRLKQLRRDNAVLSVSKECSRLLKACVSWYSLRRRFWKINISKRGCSYLSLRMWEIEIVYSKIRDASLLRVIYLMQ